MITITFVWPQHLLLYHFATMVKTCWKNKWMDTCMSIKMSNCTKILTPKHCNPLSGEVWRISEGGKLYNFCSSAKQEGKMGMQRQTYPSSGLDSQMWVYLRGSPSRRRRDYNQGEVGFLGLCSPLNKLNPLIF